VTGVPLTGTISSITYGQQVPNPDAQPLASLQLKKLALPVADQGGFGWMDPFALTGILAQRIDGLPGSPPSAAPGLMC
jgi:hypothetical protein